MKAGVLSDSSCTAPNSAEKTSKNRIKFYFYKYPTVQEQAKWAKCPEGRRVSIPKAILSTLLVYGRLRIYKMKGEYPI